MVDFMNEVDWQDGHVELELWTRLLHQASKMADHASIEIIFNKIAPFASILNNKDKFAFMLIQHTSNIYIYNTCNYKFNVTNK